VRKGPTGDLGPTDTQDSHEKARIRIETGQIRIFQIDTGPYEIRLLEMISP